MVIGIFRSRLRAGVEAAYEPVANRMVELVAGIPGFLWIKSFEAEDGERLALFAFESDDALAAWRVQLEHQEAQGRGRAEFYSEYLLTVCSPIREASFRVED